MLPQFVDFNADGHVDIFAATYDGTPHVAFGSEAGFLEPEHVLGSDGERLMLSQFWNYDDQKWDSSGAKPEGHCTSAHAWDWDADGDLDILMGDYSTGRLFRIMNHGTGAEPLFEGARIPVEVAGKAFEQEDGLTSHVLVDWDGDGLEDLVTGGYGDVYGTDPGAGIWWYRNTGKRGAPAFAAARTLVPRSPKGAQGATRPDAGIYASVADWNGDGKLDLVAGGYSLWAPPAPELTEADQARIAELTAKLEEQMDELQAMHAPLFELPEEEQEAAFEKLTSSKAYQELLEAMNSTQEALQQLSPPQMREARVWVYEQEA